MLAILRATYFLKSNNNNNIENNEIIYVDETLLPKYKPSMIVQNDASKVQSSNNDNFFGNGITDDMKVRM